jgi:hypothetical protein
MPDNAEWQILAEEAAQEKDPKKLIEIISALTAALEQRQQRKKPDDLSPSNGT